LGVSTVSIGSVITATLFLFYVALSILYLSKFTVVVAVSTLVAVPASVLFLSGEALF